MEAKNFNLNNSLGYLVNTLSLKMKQRFNARLKKRDLTVYQFGILLHIFKKGSLTQKEIATHTNDDEPATARLMNRLEEKNCVQRVISKEDRRKRLVSLTKDGEMLLNQLIPYAQEINETFTSVLSVEEKKTLFTLLTKVIDSKD